MTDPLRPLITLINTVARTKRTDSSTGAELLATTSDSTKEPTTVGIEGSSSTLKHRIRSRLSGIDKKDKKQLRKAFLEVVLLNELGDQLALDSDFSTLISKIDAIISVDNAALLSLDQLLEQVRDIE